jgi:16S rRNA (cytosine967-C5)-methyltransferase
MTDDGGRTPGQAPPAGGDGEPRPDGTRRPDRTDDRDGATRPERTGDRGGSARPERAGAAGRRDGTGRRDGAGGDRRPGRDRHGERGGPDPARRAAYEAVAAVHRDDAYANLVLPRVLDEARLAGRDAAFATELTYGTLRALGTLDAVLTAAAQRDVARIDPPARDALRLGAYQLLHTRVPAHAAVSSTVDLVRAVAPGAAGFANAVLRTVTEHDLDGWLDRLTPAYDEDPVGNLELRYSHPKWIVRAFADALGGDLTETARLLAEDNERPPVHLCVRPGLADPAEVADRSGGAPGAFSPYAVYLTAGDPGDLAVVRDGRAHVQDEGSQLVALALANAPLTGADTRWLDLCAGPGGKAGLLGAVAALRGARLTAVEVIEHRARLVERAVRGLPVDVLHADGRRVGAGSDLPEASYDRVLVDAPCTGLGALRRRPEARWRRRPADLPALTKLQRELLGGALRAVRPGGLVAYVTCSPHVVETQVTVTETARRAGVPVDLVDARPLLPPGMPGLGTGPSVQLWPHRHGTDGMFLAVLRRA